MGANEIAKQSAVWMVLAFGVLATIGCSSLGMDPPTSLHYAANPFDPRDQMVRAGGVQHVTVVLCGHPEWQSAKLLTNVSYMAEAGEWGVRVDKFQTVAIADGAGCLERTLTLPVPDILYQGYWYIEGVDSAPNGERGYWRTSLFTVLPKDQTK